MISLTRLNGESLTVNCDLIQMIESTPDTVIIFNNGERIIVKENPTLIVQKVREFKTSIDKHLGSSTWK